MRRGNRYIRLVSPDDKEYRVWATRRERGGRETDSLSLEGGRFPTTFEIDRTGFSSLTSDWRLFDEHGVQMNIASVEENQTLPLKKWDIVCVRTTGRSL